MIELNEYKQMLVNKSSYDRKTKLESQKNLILEHSDEFLQSVIDETYQFIDEVTNPKIHILHYNRILVYNKRIISIFLDKNNRVPVDKIYFDDTGKMISATIMQNVFGKQLNIFYCNHEVEYNEEFDEEGYIEYALYFEYILPENCEKIRNELFGQQLQLKRKK